MAPPTPETASAPTVVEKYRQRLVVYVVWHPDYAEGQKHAGQIYNNLTRDSAQPIARGIGIPVYFRSACPPGQSVPAPIPLDEAHHTAVIVLVDGEMVAHKNDGWAQYVGDLWRQADRLDSPHRILPVQLSKFAFDLARQSVSESNYIRIDPKRAEPAIEQLLIGVTHELCRLLLKEDRLNHDPGSPSPTIPDPVKVFISHAKVDGADFALKIRDYINNTQLKAFFDANDIPYGLSFKDVLENSVQRSALLVIQTDDYSTREWCQREVLWAKQYHRPVLVVHAVRSGEKRSFPYLGNVPTVRYDRPAPDAASPTYPGLEKLIRQLLLEVLRTEHFRQYFDDLAKLFKVKSNAVGSLSLAPELLTLIWLRKQGDPRTTFVYPDPPLGEHELDLLREFDRNPGAKSFKSVEESLFREADLNSAPRPDRNPERTLTVLTPIFLLALGAGTEEPRAESSVGKDAAGPIEVAESSPAVGPTPRLENWTIGLSISDSPDEQILGFGKVHLEDSLVEFSRYLLASKVAALAYGGDFRKGGYFEVLHDLVRNYEDDAETEPQKRLRGFIAWPIHNLLSADDKLAWDQDGTFSWIGFPSDLTGIDPKQDFRITPQNRAPELLRVWARCLTMMRSTMNDAINARVVLGGAVTGFAGRYPGIAEEVHFACRARKPLYLIGGFGGCTRAVIEAIQGKTPERLTEEFQARDPAYKGLIALFNSQAGGSTGIEPIDYPALVSEFQTYGVAGLSRDNGLSTDENERLFTTTHIVEMIYLVLKGLLTVSRKKV